MNPSSLPSPRPVTLAVLFAAVAGLAAATAQAQSIDLPQRPGYNPPRPPSPPPPPPQPVLPSSAASMPPASQHVEIQRAAPRTAARIPPRTGAYSVKFESENVITVRCLEGGTVFVSKSSIDRVPGDTPAARRETALRRTCRDIDLTK
jgi:hypothetical protein